MSSQRRTAFETNHKPSWTWHVMPALIGLAALNTLFASPESGAAAVPAAAEPVAVEAAMLYAQLTPSVQPGFGEPVLVAADLPQSY